MTTPKAATPDLPTPIQKILAQRHFSVQETIANKRFILLKGVMPGNVGPLLFKAAPNHNTQNSIRQRNHILWTRSMQATVPKDAPFHIAPILEDNSLNGTWHWFLTPFIEGSTLIEVEQPEELMPRIVALMRHIEKSSARTVAGIDARHGSVHKKDKLHLLENAVAWARNDTPFVAELLQIISANYRYLGPANAHGDFTETNIIINPQREPVLIDAEISDAFGYKYYDAIEFYNRLYTRALRPDLAQAFLRAYLAMLPRQSTQRFLNNFLCLSALRAIGNWMEITTSKVANQQKRRVAARQYAEAIVTYRIIEV